MTRGNRIIATFTCLGLLILATGGVTRAQNDASTEASRETFTIAGSVGLEGVTLQGLPGSPSTDTNGIFSVEVDSGWSGRVRPVRVGYTFDPPWRDISPVREPVTLRFSVERLRFTISGNVGVGDAILRGLPGNPVSDPLSNYVAEVPYGWSGTVAPEKKGYRFEPSGRKYEQVVQPWEDHDYKPVVVTFTIFGSAGLPGVVMQGFPGNVVTDPTGSYKVQIPYGWAGSIMPQKAGFEFTPRSREYPPVREDCPNQDYLARVLSFTISGRVWTHAPGVSGTVGVPGVRLVGLPGDVITDQDGRYTATVEHGWSGTVAATKEGFHFDPPSRVYSNVVADQKEQSFIGASRIVPDSGRDVLVIPTTGVVPEQFVQIAEDLRVMLHIFREKLSEPRMILGVLRDYGSFFGDDRKVEALYLQGTAAVFVMRVDFPYSFPTQRPQEGEAGKEPVDPVWQRARERLYSPPGSRGHGARMQAGQAQGMSFEQFKEELLQSLRHAANVRHIDPNELVVLTVIAQNEEASLAGSAAFGGVYSFRREGDGRVLGGVVGGSAGMAGGSAGGFSEARRFSSGMSWPRGGAFPPGIPAGASTTVLTMQAKKADIDAFARGDLNFEQFKQKVKAFTY
jgi:hypothetical protein